MTDDSHIQDWKSRTTHKSKQPWKKTKCNICSARTKQNKTKVWFSSHFMPSTQEIDGAYPTFPRTCQCDFAELETSRGAFQHITGPIRTWENDLKHLYYTFTLSVFAHQPTSLLPEFSRIFNWDMPPLLKLKRRINSQFLPSSLPECLSPTHFPWISLLLECTVAFGTTKSEQLQQDTYHKK